jgi:hypothetical protein
VKKPTIKMAVCAWLELPILTIRILLTSLDCLLAACDMKLRCGVWPELHKGSVPESNDKPETPGQSKEYDIDRIMRALDRRPDDAIIKLCRALEREPIGRHVVTCHHDRHLYAILKPTRSESLQRVRNVLSAMSLEGIRRCRESVR